jgi:hypothetical protein
MAISRWSWYKHQLIMVIGRWISFCYQNFFFLMQRANAEILKFGLYLLFPVATLFAFNKPEYLNLFPTKSIDEIKELIEIEKRGLYKLPTSREEREATLELIKQSKQNQ